MPTRQLHIGLSLTATWLKGQAAGRDSQQAAQPYSSDFYIWLTQLAEQAKLDFVFKPDALFLQAGGTGQPGFGSLDPTMMLAAAARETQRIGLVTTVSTTFNPPYVVARQLQSLHWISNGRAGWNIVTAIEGADNFSGEPLPSSEARYAKAAEFTEVVRKLWDSYPNEALTSSVQEKESGSSRAIRAIEHKGDFFSVKGPLNIPAHASGAIPLLQAGASAAGRSFAASTADAIFAAAPDMAAGIELRRDLRDKAVQMGRRPDDIRILPGLYFFIGETREQAQEMFRQAHAHLNTERRYAAIESILGLDLRSLPPDQPVSASLLPDPGTPVRSRTHADLLRRYIIIHEPTVKELLDRPEVTGSAHWVSVGTVDDVLRDIIAWFEAGAMDGFIALPGGSVQSLHLMLNVLVPRLAGMGLFRKEYSGTTLREHLRIT